MPRTWESSPRGQKRLAAAEQEHCQDYRYAFDISLGCYADVVNDFAKKRTKSPSREAAVDAVTKRVGLAPDAWVQCYIALLDTSKLRDTIGWRTAIKSVPLQLDPSGSPLGSLGLTPATPHSPTRLAGGRTQRWEQTRI